MKFLTAKQISGEIDSIITEAKQQIILISPYIQISPVYLDHMHDASERRVKISFVFREQNQKFMEEMNLGSIKGIELKYLENLHAKCYMNETTALITSMNLYEASENNREMGILFSNTDSADLYAKVRREADSIIAAAQKLNTIIRTIKNFVKDVTHAFCIRCAEPISENPDKPLCASCFSAWKKFGDPNYREKYCHICGKDWPSSLAKPLCKNCWSAFT